MKTVTNLIAMCAIVFSFYLFAGTPRQTADEPLRLRDLDRFVKITDQPYEMHDSTIVLCRPPEESARNPHEPAHPKTAFCNVYVNPVAKETMLSGKGIYPVGSIVIKSKLATVDAKKPELFTVMRKMQTDYDSSHGNWKYSVVDGTTLRQVAAGRIESCIECHVNFKETDYITRTYIAESPKTK